MSGFKRFFVNEIADNIIIDGEEFRHAVNVLRIKDGEEISICNGEGKEFLAKVDKINKKDMEISLCEELKNECEPKNKLTVVCGYLKGDKTELVVQKAVELGVYEIVVFSSEYSSAYMNENKLSRLNKVALEACKQCGRAYVPKVKYAENFTEAITYNTCAKNKLFACEFASCSEVDIGNLSGETVVVVGSEGGFSKAEYEKAKELGYSTVYLGKRILRAETASIALTAIIMNGLKELS